MGKYDVLIRGNYELGLFVKSCESLYIWGTGSGLNNVLRVIKDMGGKSKVCCAVKGISLVNL